MSLWDVFFVGSQAQSQESHSTAKRSAPAAYGSPAPLCSTGQPMRLPERRRERGCLGTCDATELCGDDEVDECQMVLISQMEAVTSPTSAQRQVFRAVMDDDVACLAGLVASGVDLKGVRNGAGQSPLQVAIERNKVRVRQYLEAYGNARRFEDPLSPPTHFVGAARPEHCDSDHNLSHLSTTLPSPRRLSGASLSNDSQAATPARCTVSPFAFSPDDKVSRYSSAVRAGA
eukprot:TRINITY_DN10338_c0_g1_i1.p1 TRINITY_DN10338_c0_g1~~TRINITY_DN10338_c0_g1_i1.p1  ORF type:complete len:231 (-),score=31.89 TRINITY_DN10338_c0_g1_i1:488-1180(-)